MQCAELPFKRSADANRSVLLVARFRKENPIEFIEAGDRGAHKKRARHEHMQVHRYQDTLRQGI